MTILWPVIWVACSDQQFMKQSNVLCEQGFFFLFFNFCSFKSLAIFSFSNFFWIYAETTKVSNNFQKNSWPHCKNAPQKKTMIGNQQQSRHWSLFARDPLNPLSLFLTGFTKNLLTQTTKNLKNLYCKKKTFETNHNSSNRANYL